MQRFDTLAKGTEFRLPMDGVWIVGDNGLAVASVGIDYRFVKPSQMVEVVR